MWFDRSSSLLTNGVSAVALAPADGKTIYAGGRGYILRSTDNGLTWRLSLLLSAAEFMTEIDDVFLFDEDDDVSFEDSEIYNRFTEMRDALLEDLTDEYGEEYARTLILEMGSELRDEAIGEFTSDAESAAFERDYVARVQRFSAMGFSAEDAEAAAADPREVWDLVVSPTLPAHVYAATGQGLYRSTDRGRSWQRLFFAASHREQGVLSVALTPDGQRLLIGTVAGLAISSDAGATWTFALGEVSSEPIRQVIASADGKRFYALGLRRLHRSHDGGMTWSRINLGALSADAIRQLALPTEDEDYLIAVTDRGLYTTIDGGESWEGMPTAGLDRTGLLQVLFPTESPDDLMVVAERDVYLKGANDERWRTVSNGLIGQTLVEATRGAPGEFWLATSIGLFQGLSGAEAQISTENLRALERIWALEPTPDRVIRQALAFNGLDDIPVDQWNTRAYLARFMPRAWVRFSWRQLRNEHQNSALVGDKGGTIPKAAQRWAEVRGRDTGDFDWEVFALWNLGNFLYSPVEASIESVGQQMYRARKRLIARTVRLLIRRRALQFRIVSTKRLSLANQIAFQVNLEEMTALIDGLTGGYFTYAYEAKARSASAVSPTTDAALADAPVAPNLFDDVLLRQ